MAYRYRTNGTAALKPEELATAHQTPIIDFNSLVGGAHEGTRSTLPLGARAAQRLRNDPLLGSIGFAFGSTTQSSPSQRRAFAVAFSATCLLFLGAILLGA